MDKKSVLGILGLIITSTVGTLFEQYMMRKDVKEEVEKQLDSRTKKESNEVNA